MSQRVWVLGAQDTEMEAIKKLLHSAGENVAYALNKDGNRVNAGEAYNMASTSIPIPDGVDVYLVECGGVGIDGVAIDHHRPGDPGYGRPPHEYLEASSIGQTCKVLGLRVECIDEERGLWEWVDPPFEPPFGATEAVHIAAADHCLGAAYRGKCPGVNPDNLMKWRVESRSAFQKKSIDNTMADIESARKAIREAPDLALAPGVIVKDMRGRHVPELPEAAAREGICFVADGLPDKGGKVKVVCQCGDERQIKAFMDKWGPANGLVGIYGDPARGFAGGYLDKS